MKIRSDLKKHHVDRINLKWPVFSGRAVILSMCRLLFKSLSTQRTDPGTAESDPPSHALNNADTDYSHLTVLQVRTTDMQNREFVVIWTNIIFDRVNLEMAEQEGRDSFTLCLSQHIQNMVGTWLRRDRARPTQAHVPTIVGTCSRRWGWYYVHINRYTKEIVYYNVMAVVWY